MIVNTPPSNVQETKLLDNTLRPKFWEGYIGQDKLKNTLKIMMEATKQRKEPLDHLLFYGSPGLGKTTLSYIIANEMSVNIHTTSGPALRKIGDLASIMSNLNEGDILFIDEIHRLSSMCEEMIYPAMEDFKLNVIIGKGPMAQNMEIPLPRFTLIGATTKIASITSPLRSRFGMTAQLNLYSPEEIIQIIDKSSKILNISLEPAAKTAIAQRARSTPRIANHLLKRVRDFAQVKGEQTISEKTAVSALDFLEIDRYGLGPEDRKILEALAIKFQGGPVGIKTLAAATTEEEETILDIYEPYLMKIGFLERTPKGRKVTRSAYEYLGIEYKDTQNII